VRRQAVANACAKHAGIERPDADTACAGQCAQRLEHDHEIAVELVRRPSAVGERDNPQLSLWAASGGFVVLPERCVIERTGAWSERSRGLLMHHDRPITTAASRVWLAQARRLMRRLAQQG